MLVTETHSAYKTDSKGTDSSIMLTLVQLQDEVTAFIKKLRKFKKDYRTISISHSITIDPRVNFASSLNVMITMLLTYEYAE